MGNFSEWDLLKFIEDTYPVSYISMILVGFGAAILGLARKAYFKNQSRIIESLERIIDRLMNLLK